MLDGTTFVFHTRDGAKRQFRVPRTVWEEAEDFFRLFGARYDTFIEHELNTVGEDLADYDLRAIASELIADLHDARPQWRRTQALLARAAELAEKYDVDAGMAERTMRDLDEPERDWLVPGLIAKGGVLLIGGREKLSGKSWLLAYLNGKLQRNEDTPFGPAYGKVVRTLTLTEEPRFSIRAKLNRFDLEAGWIVEDHKWPLDNFDGATAQERWQSKLKLLEALAVDIEAEHVIIDPLARVSAVEDEAGRELGSRMEAVGAFAYRTNFAVTVVHHANKKEDAKREDKMRGSTSLGAAADQIVYIQRHESDVAAEKYPNQRELLSYGRVEESCWELTIDFDDGSSEYKMVDVKADVAELKREATAQKHAAEALLHMNTVRKLANVGGAAGSVGVTATMFANEAGITVGGAAKILKRLEDEGRLKSTKDGRERKYYEAGSSATNNGDS